MRVPAKVKCALGRACWRKGFPRSRRGRLCWSSGARIISKGAIFADDQYTTKMERRQRPSPPDLLMMPPSWFDLAHRKLDQAVLEAYGWPHDLDDEEILERLLALNLERAGA